MDARLAGGGMEAEGGRLQNVDLWRKLCVLASRFDMSYECVPGRSGDPTIRMCDRMDARDASAQPTP